jgi:hypothetical protein
MEKQSLLPLLESVVQDNPTYKFPVETISKELTSMFIEPLEFDYFTIQSYRKLKREFGDTLAHIFLSTLEMKLILKERDIYKLSTQEYQEEIENFITTMEK